MNFSRFFTLPVWNVLLAMYVQNAFSDNRSISEPVLSSWSADAAFVARHSDMVVLGKIGETLTWERGSWNRVSSSIWVEKVLKGGAVKHLPFQSLYMEDAAPWELDSMWALECGVTVRGGDDRKVFAAMQSGVKSHEGRRAIVFLRNIRGHWQMLAMYPETDADGFRAALGAVALRKGGNEKEGNPLRFTISLPERVFANSAIIPVRCVLSNRSAC